MVLLQTILILILVYYGLKLLLKWLAPRLLNYAAKKTKERFGEQFGNFNRNDTQTNNSKRTSFGKKQEPKANASKKVGEYIDFEEIE